MFKSLPLPSRQRAIDKRIHTPSPLHPSSPRLILSLLAPLPKTISTVYSPKSSSAVTNSTASMGGPAHNAWATPHGLALQQLEYTRRHEALAREAATRYQQCRSQQGPPMASQLKWVVLDTDKQNQTLQPFRQRPISGTYSGRYTRRGGIGC